MVRVLALVLALLFCGETAAALLDVPIPGAALGLAALTAHLAIRGGPDPEMARLFDGAAPNMPLLFVPAAAGIVANLDLLTLFWAQFVAAVVLGTGATLLVAGLCAQAMLRFVRQSA